MMTTTTMMMMTMTRTTPLPPSPQKQNMAARHLLPRSLSSSNKRVETLPKASNKVSSRSREATTRPKDSLLTTEAVVLAETSTTLAISRVAAVEEEAAASRAIKAAISASDRE